MEKQVLSDVLEANCIPISFKLQHNECCIEIINLLRIVLLNFIFIHFIINVKTPTHTSANHQLLLTSYCCHWWLVLCHYHHNPAYRQVSFHSRTFSIPLTSSTSFFCFSHLSSYLCVQKTFYFAFQSKAL